MYFVIVHEEIAPVFKALRIAQTYFSIFVCGIKRKFKLKGCIENGDSFNTSILEKEYGCYFVYTVQCGLSRYLRD